MVYEFRLSVPANTRRTAPKTRRLKVTGGVITWLQWFWPPGTHQLAHAIVEHRGRQIFPDNLSDDLTDNGQGPATDVYYVVRRPYELVLKAWNDDDTYSHTFTLRFNLLPRAVAEAQKDTARFMREFVNIVRELWLGRGPVEEEEGG